MKLQCLWYHLWLRYHMVPGGFTNRPALDSTIPENCIIKSKNVNEIIEDILLYNSFWCFLLFFKNPRMLLRWIFWIFIQFTTNLDKSFAIYLMLFLWFCENKLSKMHRVIYRFIKAYDFAMFLLQSVRKKLNASETSL